MKRRGFLAGLATLLGIGSTAAASDAQPARFVGVFRLSKGGKVYTTTWGSKEEMLGILPHLKWLEDDEDGELRLVSAGVTSSYSRKPIKTLLGSEQVDKSRGGYDERIRRAVNDWQPSRGETLCLGDSCTVVVI